MFVIIPALWVCSLLVLAGFGLAALTGGSRLLAVGAALCAAPPALFGMTKILGEQPLWAIIVGTPVFAAGMVLLGIGVTRRVSGS